MSPVIPSSTSNIALSLGTTFATTKNNSVTRCSILQKSTKRILTVQKYILPMSTSVRLFPQFRSGCGLRPKSRIDLVSATGTDLAVEEADSPVADREAIESPSGAVETTEESSIKSDSSSTPAQSKRSRPVRKSEMPPVKNEELVAGATFTGKVKSIQPFGAFVDFGAFTDGLVHVSRLSESFVRDVGSVVSLGQEVKVRLVEANTETGRISLTMRESDDISKLQQQKNAPANPDKTRSSRRGPPKPNQRKDEVKRSSKFVKGQDLNGTVKNLTRSGAFISLPEGEEGFLPTSEESVEGFGSIMGGSSLQVGQEVNVRVLRITRGQVTLTMKKEEEAGELDTKLKQGNVHTAINPFMLAFRKNKDIAAFLDKREKEEVPAENAGMPNEAIEGKVSKTEIGLDDPGVQDKSVSSVEGLASVSSAVNEMGENETSLKEADVGISTVDDALNENPESIVSDSSQNVDGALQSVEEGVEVNSAVDEMGDNETSLKEADVGISTVDNTWTAESESTDSLQNVDGAVQTIEDEAEVNSEILASEGSASTDDKLTETPTPLDEAVNDGESDLSGQIADQFLLSEVTENQADDVIANHEAQIQTPSEENEILPAPPLVEETVGPNAEKNGSISNEQINDLPPLESTTKESQVSEVGENQIDSTVVNDELPIQTPTADGKTPIATVTEEEQVGPAPEKIVSVPNSNGQSDAHAQKEVAAKVAISPALVKQLREETGAGMMDCKKALTETGGDLVKAQEYLRKKGLASADKKASRATAEGRIGSYIHDSRIGVLVEINCETDFVSRGDIFKELVDDLAMQVAACPQVQVLVTEDVPQEIVDKEREIEMQKEDLLLKPEQIRSKIVEGRIRKRLEELALLEQPYIKNDKVVVKDWVKQTIATIGENIKVTRFVRYNLGEGLEKKSQDFAAEVAAQTAAKPVPAPVQEQPATGEAKDTVEKPKATVSAALVKQLREETGAGMMDCKKALSETGGDLEKAQEYLRKKGLSAADKKSTRLAAEGRIGSYIHDTRIGVLVEVNCETDFVGRSEKFKELVDDLAMQVVAYPQVQYVSIEDIPESIRNKEKELEMQREDLLSKPENIRERIVEGRLSKRLGELALLEQPFIKNDSVLVKDLVKQTVAAIGENIKVRRFVRFTLGETTNAKVESEA
ncbi:unnamed protein product [Ilex paraguariensis]|uniref:Elongation factor Ts, mitochondrial n=1 Tax=Ilex paraguariensis TaxID=185542 RepID=A0ABC8TTF0_9AQUA